MTDSEEVDYSIRDAAAEWEAEIRKLFEIYPVNRGAVNGMVRDLEFNQDFHGSATVSLKELISNTLMIEALDSPDAVTDYIKDALQRIIPKLEKYRKRYTVHFIGHPKPVNITSIRSKDIGRLIAVRGMVRQVSEVKPKVIVAAFQCRNPACGDIQMVPQQGREIEYPMQCQQDGCNSRRFRAVAEMSTLCDNQKIRLQDMPEALKAGAQPESLDIEADYDLCHQVSGGDRVILTGTLRADMESGNKATAWDRYMDLTGVEKLDDTFSDIEIDEKDEEEIRAMARDPNLISNIVRSVAPSIYGHDMVKMSIALQLAGGITKEGKDSASRLRGDFHILLCGDPGIAKSQLLRFAAALSPRGIFVTGKNASKAGLTATAVNDAFGDGRWTLEAGALVLADGGLVAADEIDKMNKDDVSALHEALEQGTVTVSKAGINATLKARCSMLAAANPVASRFDMYQPLAAQVGLQPTILDRFDLIFFMQDTPSPDMDRMIGSHILKSHKAGREGNGARVPYSVKQLRKYIAYVKQHCRPEMTPEAEKLLLDYYLSVRGKASGPNAAIPITARQMEGLIRLAEAHAKIRLADKVETVDAKASIDLSDTCLNQVAYDSKTNTFDFDRISGVPKAQRDIMSLIKESIKKLMDPTSKRTKRDDIYKDLENRGFDRTAIDETIDRMCDAGILMQPRRGEVSFV